MISSVFALMIIAAVLLACSALDQCACLARHGEKKNLYIEVNMNVVRSFYNDDISFTHGYADKFKLGIFTDPHYCNKEITCVTRRSLMSYDKIKEAMEHFSAQGVDAVICLGDLIDDCDTYEGNVEYAQKLIKLISDYGKPFFCLMGNHDHLDFTREDFARITKSYPPFSVQMGDSLLVFLDCNYHDDGEPYSPKRADWTNSYLPKDQLDELEKVLLKNKDKKAYIFSHQPLENTLEPIHVVRNAQKVREIINEAGNVKRAFSGHYHPGNEVTIDGVVYTTLPAMCEGEENRYFVVDI